MANVVITGGSRGIGSAAVEAFAAKGHRVWFLYEKNHEAARVVSEKTGATGICCDVADKAAVEQAFSQIPDVDILICNAGIMDFGLMSMLTEERWDRIFAVNVKGIYHCVNGAMEHFLRKQKGCIITVSSMWGQVGASCEVAYSATKGAIIAMSKALAKELCNIEKKIDYIDRDGNRIKAEVPSYQVTEYHAFQIFNVFSALGDDKTTISKDNLAPMLLKVSTKTPETIVKKEKKRK